MGPSDPPGDGEADAQSREVRGLVEALEEAEDALGVIGGEAHAVVADDDLTTGFSTRCRSGSGLTQCAI